MENLERMLEKALGGVNHLANEIDENKELKEYLIENCYWNEDYSSEMNVVELLTRYLTQGRSL